MMRKFLLFLLCCIGAAMSPLCTLAESGYVGDEIFLDRPSLPYNATKIRSVMWSGQYSDGISCSETSTGMRVRITKYFSSSKSISCQIEYEWQSGDRTLTSHVFKSYTIYCNAVDIDVHNDNMTLSVGQRQMISYSLSPPKNASLTFRSNNTSVATVSSYGEVTAVGPGYAIITIEQNMGNEATCRVEVTNPVEATSISLREEAAVDVYSSIDLYPTIEPSEAHPTLTWKSDDTSIATVDQSGKVTGKTPGTATITVTTDNDLSASCVVTVNDVDRTAQRFAFREESSQKTMYVGDTWRVLYTVEPSYAVYSLSWTSSDESVATVSYGQVKAVRQGTARITASVDGTSLSDYCDVTVKGIPNVMTIWFVNGQRTDIQLSENINMTFMGDKFVVKSATMDVEYEAIDVRKFTLESDGSEVVGVKKANAGAADSVIDYDGNAILLSGFPPNTTVQLFAVSGQADGAWRIGQDGCLAIPVDGLSRGVHIVKTESITYKIIKK